MTSIRDVVLAADLGLEPPESLPRVSMVHVWSDLAFIHWRFDAALLQPLLPRGLEVDRFDGCGWVGLVPFFLEVRFPPWMPSLPRLSQTLEINVRTYVRGPDGRRGIWFLSLDAGRLTPVAIARCWYRIPYHWAKMSYRRNDRSVRYESVRRTLRADPVQSKLELEPAHMLIEPSALERFLICRWRLYSPGRRGLMATQIEHEPWPVRAARLLELRCELLRPFGLEPPADPPLVHFTEGVRVRFGPRIRIS